MTQAVGGSVGPWRESIRRLRANGRAVAALAVLLVLALAGVFAPLLTHYDPTTQLDIVAMKSLPPSAAHPFGTDPYSRDVLARVLYGTRVSLRISLLAVAIATTVGTTYGAMAGYCGGRIDSVLMRLIDACLSVPRVLLLVAVVALWGALPIGALALLLGLTGWFGVSRLVRAEVRSIATREFVTSARALGAGHGRILVRHVLPHVVSSVIVAAALGIGNVIVVEAGLSFLGLGVPQPTPSWGNIIADGREALALHWWLSVFPGVALAVTVLAVNVLGDSLRDALNPRQHL